MKIALPPPRQGSLPGTIAPPARADSMRSVIPARPLAAQGGTRSNCSLSELCVAKEPCPGQAENRNGYTCSRKRVRRGDRLYRIGDPFTAVYPVTFGSFKTSVATASGGDQVLGLHMHGEIMGFDGVDTGRHACTAIALEDSLVCRVSFDVLEETCAADRGLQRQFHRAMSRQIELGQWLMLMLGSMHAEERLAAFLLNVSERFAACGFSRYEFNLRMTREEIGSLIGLKLETVSRTMGRFQDRKLISVAGKAVAILDLPGLRRVIGSGA